MFNFSILAQALRIKVINIFAHLVGAAVAVIALLVILIGAYHSVLTLIALAFGPFFLFVVPVFTLLLCIGVIFSTHPVHSLLCLITVFFNTTLLYLYLGAEFLAFLFLIVYVGAIAILFLFVIMLLNLKPTTEAASQTLTGVTGPIILVYMVSMGEIFTNSLNTFLSTGLLKTYRTDTDVTTYVTSEFADILAFSNLLYTYHNFLFFISSLLLLTAMLGAIILATSATDTEVKKTKI